MKNTFGQSVTISLFGESHGNEIGALLSGIAPGIKIDVEYIKSRLALRKAVGNISTARQEEDGFTICSGVFNGYTTGSPICITIQNSESRSADYESNRYIARPGHADYTSFCKYHGFEDYRGGGHFSGRITAALVAAGSIAQFALKSKGIEIGTHIKCCANIEDSDFISYKNDISTLENKLFAVLDDSKGEQMIQKIRNAAEEGDSVGGILETAVIGVPPGVGEPFFDSLESVTAHILFSIPAVKGVEFGRGFDIAKLNGSEANDAFCCDNGVIRTKTNNNGGINGGISNGMPIIVRCAVKPTSSIYKQQESINLKTGKGASLLIQGRHDPAIIHRARVVADAAIALAICDMLALRYGTDYLRA